MSLSHRAGQHRYGGGRDSVSRRDDCGGVVETGGRGDHRRERPRAEHDRNVDAIFRIWPNRLRPWWRCARQPLLGVKTTTADTQRCLVRGGWRGYEPWDDADTRVSDRRHHFMAKGDVLLEDARGPAAHAARARWRRDLDDIGVTGNRVHRGVVREKDSRGLEEVL